MSDTKPDEAARSLAAIHGVEYQPDPVPDTGAPSAHDLVIADLVARREFGMAKYGTALQYDNGRDHLEDAYAEVLDLAAYLRNEIERRRRERNDHP